MEKITITNTSAGKRTDKFLSEEFFSLSRAEIIRQIRKGKVLINGKATKPSHVLSEGDVIGIEFEIEKGELVANPDMEMRILFEDDNVVAIDKPAGVQMHPSAVEKENTVANWLIARYPSIKDVHDGSEESYLRPGIVHRLDKDTSGVVVIAKNKESFFELKRLFSERWVTKKYVALLFGNLQERGGTIEKPIARATNFKRQKIAVGRIKGKAKDAVTKYKVLESWDGFDLVEAEPKTGRMHQIRIHFFSIGHPVVGDGKYFLNKYKGLELECAKRQLLHAKELRFELFGKKYEFSTDIPEDFARCLVNID